MLAAIFRWSGGITLVFAVVGTLAAMADRGSFGLNVVLVSLPIALAGLVQIGFAEVIEAVIRTAKASERAADAMEEIAERARKRAG